MTHTILLTQGKAAIVDDDEFEKLVCYKWHLLNGDYAVRHEAITRKTILMHREIIDAPKGLEVDHIDGNCLNNQKCNLRLTDRTGNRRNSPVSKVNTTGYKGVTMNRSGSWAARIGLQGRHIHLGTYHTPEEAAAAYNKAAIQYFEDFARLNNLPDKIHTKRVLTTGKLGLLGVSITNRKSRSVYRARLTLNGKRIHIGYFDDPILAALAYNDAVKQLDPNRSKFNFPGDNYE